MSSTALVVFAVYAAGLVLGFVYRPIFAVFSYLWIFYNDPESHWWGADLPELRYSMYAAVVALIATMRIKVPRDAPSWAGNGAAVVLILYACWMWIQTGWAVDPAGHPTGAIMFTKYVVLFYIVYRVTASDPEQLNLFLWAHVVGCFILGWEAFRSTGTGRLETVSAPGVDDANMLAAHLVTGLTAAGFLFVGTKRWWRWIALGTIPFILNAVVLTQSRGGFLALLAAGLAALFLAPKVHRKFVGAALVLGAVLLAALANQDFWDRIATIRGDKSQGEETRVQLIGPQFQMFKDHPFGAGYRGNVALSRQYMPAELLSNNGSRAAHNTFMAALVDQGAPGAILLLSLYAWMFITLRRLRRSEGPSTPPELILYTAAIGTALASCVIAGLFLNLLTFEVQVWLVALLAALTTLHRSHKVPAGSEVKVAPVEANPPRGGRRLPRPHGNGGPGVARPQGVRTSSLDTPHSDRR